MPDLGQQFIQLVATSSSFVGTEPAIVTRVLGNVSFSSSVTVGTASQGTPNSSANAWPMKLVDAGGATVANLFAFHNTDNQALGASAVGLNTGGVAQLLNVAGNIDRQRETGADAISSAGVVTSANQYASPFFLTGSTSSSAGSVSTISASLSGSNAGAPWSIQSGSTLSIGVTTDAGYENVFVTNVNKVGQTFQAIFANVHAAGFGITGSVYNQGRDATVPDGSPGKGFQAGATYLFNQNLSSGVGGWERERSANGEQDNATGAGTAIAAGYGFTNQGFDRERNLQGCGWGSGSLQANAGSGVTTVTPGVVPTGLQPGAPVIFWGGTPEVAYTSGSYAAGSSPILLASGTQFAHNSGTTITWDTFTVFGPGLGPINPTGKLVSEEMVYDPVTSASYLERAATQDGCAGQNVVIESMGVLNAAGTFDRQRAAYQDALPITGIVGENELVFNGTTFDRARSVGVGDQAPSTGIGADGIMLLNPSGTFDRLKGQGQAAQVTPVAAASGGSTPFWNDAVTNQSVQVKSGSSGQIYMLSVYNPSPTPGYLQIFPTFSATVGTTAPQWVVHAPSLFLHNLAIGAVPVYIGGNGISIAATTTPTGSAALANPLSIVMAYN